MPQSLVPTPDHLDSLHKPQVYSFHSPSLNRLITPGVDKATVILKIPAGFHRNFKTTSTFTCGWDLGNDSKYNLISFPSSESICCERPQSVSEALTAINAFPGSSPVYSNTQSLRCFAHPHVTTHTHSGHRAHTRSVTQLRSPLRPQPSQEQTPLLSLSGIILQFIFTPECGFSFSFPVPSTFKNISSEQRAILMSKT